MDTGDKATPVTRREFYSALVLVWTFIMFAFSTTAFGGSRWPTAANAIYLVASLFMVTNYSIASLRASLRSDISRKRVVIAVALLVVVALIIGTVAFLTVRISN